VRRDATLLKKSGHPAYQSQITLEDGRNMRSFDLDGDPDPIPPQAGPVDLPNASCSEGLGVKHVEEPLEWTA
jgi:hypothetical protein